MEHFPGIDEKDKSSANKESKKTSGACTRREFLRRSAGGFAAFAGYYYGKKEARAQSSEELQENLEKERLLKLFTENLSVLDRFLKKIRSQKEAQYKSQGRDLSDPNIQKEIAHAVYSSFFDLEDAQTGNEEDNKMAETAAELNKIIDVAAEKGILSDIVQSFWAVEKTLCHELMFQYLLKLSRQSLKKNDLKAVEIFNEELLDKRKIEKIEDEGMYAVCMDYFYEVVKTDDPNAYEVLKRIPDYYLLGEGASVPRDDDESCLLHSLVIDAGNAAMDEKRDKKKYGSRYPIAIIENYCVNPSLLSGFMDHYKARYINGMIDNHQDFLKNLESPKVISFLKNIVGLATEKSEQVFSDKEKELLDFPASLALAWKFSDVPLFSDVFYEKVLGENKSEAREKKEGYKKLCSGQLSNEQTLLIGKFENSQKSEVQQNIFEGLAQYLNNIHDVHDPQSSLNKDMKGVLRSEPEFELISNLHWEEQVYKCLESLPTERLMRLFFLGSQELYTGVFNIVFNNVVDRIQREGGKDLISWVGENIKNGQDEAIAKFLLTLSSRKKLSEFIDKVYREEEKKSTRKTLGEYIFNKLTRTIQEIEKNPAEIGAKTNIAYLINSFEELFGFEEEENQQYFKQKVRDLPSESGVGLALKLLIFQKFGMPISELESKHAQRVNKVRKIIDYFEQISYESLIKDGTLRVLINFSGTAAAYGEELEKLLSKKKYKSSNGQGTFEGNINGIKIEYTLVYGQGGDDFKKLLEEGNYSIIFTRHHSYEGASFCGVGSDKVLPQISGTVGTGQGMENNALVIVASEEIAKGYGQGITKNKNWDEVWKEMGKRQSLNNFVIPNNISFILSHLANLDFQEESATKSKEKLQKVVIFDGGCGGVNRIPQYISAYKDAVNKL